jgi:hypothetical protein
MHLNFSYVLGRVFARRLPHLPHPTSYNPDGPAAPLVPVLPRVQQRVPSDPSGGREASASVLRHEGLEPVLSLLFLGPLRAFDF